jgi:hypothetical protein
MRRRSGDRTGNREREQHRPGADDKPNRAAACANDRCVETPARDSGHRSELRELGNVRELSK